jgi:hypothetical protein
MNVEGQNGVVTLRSAVGLGAETRHHVGTKSAPSSQVAAQDTAQVTAQVAAQVTEPRTDSGGGVP